MIKLKKKGVVYVLIVLFIIIVITVLALTISQYSFRDREEAKRTRIRVLDDFLKSFHQDAPRAIYIASFRSLIGLEEFVSSSGHFLNDTEVAFAEIFYNGTLYGNTFYIMNQSSFSAYQARVNQISREIDATLNTRVVNISLFQNSSWSIIVEVMMEINFSDNKGLATWMYNRTLWAEIPVYDIKDPIYSVGTLGKYINTIRKSPITVFVNDSGDKNDTTGLQLHLNESYYIENPRAPSFLQRFENDLTNSAYGIESLVNLRILGDQGWPIGTNNQSVVDWIYFDDKGTNNTCDIQNMEFTPDWFIMDENHLDTYQIDGNLEYNPC